MRLEDKLAAYLEYCEYRKELDRKTQTSAPAASVSRSANWLTD